MSTMTNIHRGLVQQIMKTGYIEKSDFETILKQLSEGSSVTTKDVSNEDFLSTINSNLEQFHMRVQTIVHPRNKKTYYGLINQVDDEISKIATHFTPVELLQGIAQSEETGSDFLTVDASNLRERSTKIDESERCIEKLVKDGWLEQNRNKLYFGIRTLLDLRTYLDQEFAIEI